MSVTLGIIGASVRAAAESALRGGFRVRGIDQFADRDCAPTVENGRDFSECEGWLDRQRGGCTDLAWMYVGGLENSPDLVDRLARKSPLLGIGGDRLRRLRNPEHLLRVLRAGGFNMPEMALEPTQVRVDESPGRWLLKRRHSAAGRGIAYWNATTRVSTENCYLQREILGQSRSGAYLAEADQCRLLGVFDGLPPEPQTGAQPFWYAGSLGPRPLTPIEFAYWHALGQWIWQAFSLRGLFGVDAMVEHAIGVNAGDAITGEPDPLVLEVNPRLTASMELLDRVDGSSIVAKHVQACLGDQIDPPDASTATSTGIRRNAAPRAEPTASPCHAKAILYATRPTSISASLSDAWMGRKQSPHLRTRNAIADIPWPGSRIERGAPIVTVFGGGPSLQQARTDLREQIQTVRREIDADQHP